MGDNVKVGALIDGSIDVEMEVLEEGVVVNDYVGTMRDEILDLNNAQEVHDEQDFSMPMSTMVILTAIFLHIR